MMEDSDQGSVNRELRDKTNSRWSVLGVCLFLFAITWLVFGQTLSYDFVNFDDDRNVYENQNVTPGLSWHGLGWAFTHSQERLWTPLTTLSHMAACQWFGVKA